MSARARSGRVRGPTTRRPASSGSIAGLARGEKDDERAATAVHRGVDLVLSPPREHQRHSCPRARVSVPSLVAYRLNAAGCVPLLCVEEVGEDLGKLLGRLLGDEGLSPVGVM